MNKKVLKLVFGISVNAIAIIFVIFLIYYVGNEAFSFGAKIFNEQSVDSEGSARDVEITISEGDSIKELTEILYNKGLIEDKKLFYTQAFLSAYKNELKAGTYTLNTAMKPTDILKLLSGEEESGESIN